MRTKKNELEIATGTRELHKEELFIVNGGGFAYDFGFFLRECVVYLANGGGQLGTLSAITDFSINYKAAN